MIKILFSLVLFMVFCRFNSAQGPSPKKNVYASILQDARYEPTPDGTFGYLYKTEDGIVSSARGGPNGVIQGGFSYTDPTGLKVNINYNAGSRSSPSAVEPPSRPASVPASATAPSRYYSNRSNSRTNATPAPAPVYRSEPRYYESSQDYDQYQEQQYPDPEPRYIPRSWSQPTYRRPQYVYQRRNSPMDNEIYDDYNYRN